MILARTPQSVQAAITQQQLSKVEKRISDFQLNGNVVIRKLPFILPQLVRTLRSFPPAALG